MNDRSLAAAEALLRYRRGDDADPAPVRDLCRRLLNALGDLVAPGAAGEADAHLVATALEMVAEHDATARNLRNELALLLDAGPAAMPSIGTTESRVHLQATGDHSIVIGAGRDIHNHGHIGHVTQAERRTEDESSSPRPSFAVLFAAASPDGQDGLRVDREERALREALRRSGMRDQVRVETRMAVRPLEFTQALLEVRPRVVHFAGHGDVDGGILLEHDDGYSFIADAEGLRGLFAQMDGGVECVILNACYSRRNADAILHAVPYVIGMDGPLHDDAAIVFATGFYQALGEGRDVPAAHAWGSALMRMMKAEGEMPVLDSRPR